MAISKSLRYQVLRRDGHRCHYCGGHPPNVRLVLDHVLPIALGGSDTADNLITSCEDCNAGKGATPPDAAKVDEVNSRNEQWAAAIAQAAAEMKDDSDYSWFLDYWNHWNMHGGGAVPLDTNWRSALDVWQERGLTREIILGHVRRAMDKPDLEHLFVFRYFAGCCWRSIDALEEQAKQILERRSTD